MIAARLPENSNATKSTRAPAAAICALLALVLLAYSNHFGNGFHFDDSHAIVDNPYIRELRNIPLFFTDGRTSSVLPANRAYRPVVSTSLAVDYRLSGGLKPLWFHISTFFWFLVQLGLMFMLFRAILDRTRPGERDWNRGANFWVALFATAIYAAHPAIAETVNYIVQRADLYAALAVVAGLVVYIEFPKLRRTGLYLLPVILGILSKGSAAVFPALLFPWIWLFDEEAFRPALLRTLPSLAVSGLASWFVLSMTPSTFVGGASSPWAYRLAQPAALMRYFRKFFLPLDLSADTDRGVVTGFFTVDAIGGILFVAALASAAWWCSRRREVRPIAFGLAWFLIASVPTSVIALSEVENDHRMYMPFVGLTLAVCWAAYLALERQRVSATIPAFVCALVLAGFAWGTFERNKVWKTDASLWYDVTLKSPQNGRGLMNYGLSQMETGRTDIALTYFLRAATFNPNYYVLETNTGIAYSVFGNAAEAERHFARAIQLAPQDASAHYFYARWLANTGRRPEASALLDEAIRDNPDYALARYLRMQIDADNGDAARLRKDAEDTLARFPGDATAASWLARTASLSPAKLPSANFPPAGSVPAPRAAAAADAFLAQSLAFYQAGRYRECVEAARMALKTRPDYAEAWNNIGAAYNQMSQWDRAIAAETQALRLKPDLQLARNNLAVALKAKENSKANAGEKNPGGALR